MKLFPVSTHVLSKLQGPLAVEGGVTGADRSLQPRREAARARRTRPLFAIGPQPPESKQIDVLNIFNDGSQQDRAGTMTSTTIKGLGMADDLDFGPTYSSGNPQTFGEPAIFPGGISYGTVQFVDGKFPTDGGKSTIEVVNLLLGQGNDNFDDPRHARPGRRGQAHRHDRHHADGDGHRPPPLGAVRLEVAGLPRRPARPHLRLRPVWTVPGFGDDFLGDTVDNTVMHLSGHVATAAGSPPPARRRSRSRSPA